MKILTATTTSSSSKLYTKIHGKEVEVWATSDDNDSYKDVIGAKLISKNKVKIFDRNSSFEFIAYAYKIDKFAL